MFESLSEFDNIVVSGPQRSGTRIGAKIIAYDTSKTYIDEKDVNWHDFHLLQYYLSQGGVVVQCPALCHLLHCIVSKNTLVVLMRRNVDDITNSEHLHWNNDSNLIELYKYGYSNGIISRIKYDYWESVQKPILGNRCREVNFQDLKEHKLFISKRKDFRWDQTHLKQS